MNRNIGIIVAAIFASAVISGGLVFAGVKYFDKELSTEEFNEKVAKGIEAYIQSENQKAAAEAEKANQPIFVEGDFTDDDAVMGEEDSPVVMVEFSDYQCPYCKSFVDETLPQIKEKYIDTGKLKLVFRDYPLGFHPDAFPAALFAECVRDQTDDEAYFKIHDEIFKTIAAGFNYDDMEEFAVGLGANKAELKTCFDEEKFKDEIAADQAEGEGVGISGTPGFIINGQVLSGARPFEYFEAIIEEQLAK